jgi:hypothetical protein
MTLAEKIIEKKRLAALEAASAPQAPAVIATVTTGTEQPSAAQTEDLKAVEVSKEAIVAKAVEEVPLVDANGKPLSGFALVKARKEAAAKAALNLTPSANIEPIVQNQPLATAAIEQRKKEITTNLAEAVKQVVAISADEEEKYEAATPETRQAYADVKERLNNLVSMAGEDLRGEMALLKKALMQNPNAVELMLPSDIGQMVIGLRKMTGVELAAVKEGKATGTRKKKEVALTAEELEKAWEEL